MTCNLRGILVDHYPISSAPRSFQSVELAWFWTIRALRASPTERPGAADVIKCLDELYRTRRIEMVHVRIMRIWGLRGVAPNPARARERSDWRFWHEAMNRMDSKLRARGIVAAPISQDAAD